MASRILTQDELDSVAGMPSRLAGEKLGVGKTTINDARRLAREHNGRLPKVAETKPSVEVSSKVPTTKAEIDQRLHELGWNEDEYTFHYSFSDYDQGDTVKHALKATAIPKKVAVVLPVEAAVDPFAVLAEVRSIDNSWSLLGGDPYGEIKGSPEAFCLSINDIQLGQSYNGGSAETIKQFYRHLELAKQRINELRSIGRNLSKLVIVFGGDLVEGCVIYPNQAFSLDLDRKSQIEGVIALGMLAIDTLAPAFDSVQVLACKGNHGENRINGKYTTLYDNDDTHVVEMMKLGFSRDPLMQHIEWTIAGEEAAVAIKVFDWVLGTTHGDVYAKGVPGATVDKKAQSWLKNMAAARRKFGLIADTDVFITHHFHHDKMSDWGDTLWRQTPSQDRGSPYYEQATGEYSEPGMLTWVMSERSRYKDEQVLR